MLKAAFAVAIGLVPHVAMAAGHHRHHRSYSEDPIRRVDEPGILIGPVIACSHTHLFIGTFTRCENGLSQFDPTDVPGF